MNTLPDEIYRKIIGYLFIPSIEIKNYFRINAKCFSCKRKQTIPPGLSWLHHYCYVCNPNDHNISKSVKNIVCSNTLRCFRCIH